MARFERLSAVGGVVICCVLAPGCASNQKLARMNPLLPIETTNGYRQEGRVLDPEDMGKKLSAAPATAGPANRARVLTTLAVILAGAGGALAGWPLGEYAGGKQDPNWNLLYAGGGAVVVSVPLLLWGVGSMNSAVEAHNRSLSSFP